MFHRHLAVLVLALVAAFAAAPDAHAQCSLTGYTAYDQDLTGSPLSIPDNSPGGVTTSPLAVPADGSMFTDVIVSMLVGHTFVGDLVVRVSYDVNCDGTPEAFATIVNQPALSTGSCGGNLNCTSDYLFSDAATTEISTPTCPAAIPAGCYAPSPVSVEPLSAFDGLMKGGCFRMTLSDNVAADIGSLCRWTVHATSTGPTATGSTTWGSIKTRYR